MTSRVVMITSSPGAGKTTIIGRVALDKRYKTVNVGTLMFDIAVKKGYVKDRDRIRYLSPKLTSAMREQAFKKISEMKGNIVVDTHASVEEHGRYVPGLPVNSLKLIKNLAGFIYIDAATEDVVERRRKDTERSKREREDPRLIDIQRLVNMSILSTASSVLNIPLFIIFNKRGKLDESVGNTRSLLEEIFG